MLIILLIYIFIEDVEITCKKHGTVRVMNSFFYYEIISIIIKIFNK